MRERMKQQLTHLAIGELVAAAVFWFNYFLFKDSIGTVNTVIPITFALFVLSFILVQGSVFWWILIKRLSKPRFAAPYASKAFGVLSVVDVLMLAVSVLVVVMRYGSLEILITSLAIWILAVLEYVNYYKIRLSYGINPFIVLKYAIQGNLRKSRIAKEIERSL